MRRLALAIVFLILIGNLLSCLPLVSEEQMAKIAFQMQKEYLSRNTLIHMSISEPKGWKRGSENPLQVQSDFPFVESTWDFAIFSHPSSRSSVFVSYKPILGISYFSGDPKNVADWFKEAHLKVYKTYKAEWVEVADGSVDSCTREIGGKTFYVIKNEIFSNLLKEKRAVYIFLHIPEDVKSLYMFCFSTLAKKGIEEEKPFQDFLAMVSGHKTNQLEPYDEALYRNSEKLWMANYEYKFYMDVKWHKAIVDESIEELKRAATLRPDGWEPHYLLMMEYSSGYFLGYPVVVADGKPKVVSGIWPFSSQPINADAAVEEFKHLVKLNPDFRNISRLLLEKWHRKPPNLGLVYMAISRMLNELKRYDEAISYLEEGVKKGPFDFRIEDHLVAFYRFRAKRKAQKQDYDGAIRDYMSLMAVRGYPYTEVAQYEDYRDLAGLYIDKGMKKEALEAYSKALEIVRKGKSFSGIRKKNIADGLEARIKELQKQ